MNDLELAALIKEYEPLVQRAARAIWLEAGSPDGIRPDDLINHGRSGLLEAISADEDTGSLRLRATVKVRSRIQDGLRDLQVGAVTTKAVERPDGALGRFAYAVSSDVGAIEEQLQDDRPRVSRELKRLQKRLQRQFSSGGFQESSAAYLDYAEAVSRIPDELDRFVLFVFTMVQALSPADAPAKVWRVLEGFWSRRKTALAVTQHLLSRHATSDHVAARLERAARWINAYCSGRPMTEYPELRPIR